MYVPGHFAADGAAVDELLRDHGAAHLITQTAGGLVATMLPFIYVPAAGEHGALHGHLARGNPQWELEAAGEALVIVSGPDAYITPSWYPSAAGHGWVVPTWDYVVAHVYGRLVVHDDPVWTEDQVRRLVAKHEGGSGHPRRWSVDDAPADFIAGMVRAIVGVELVISHVEAAVKLSQNRPAADVDGVIGGLRARGDARSADAVRRANAAPRAE
jgi:transcriptional regulator